MFSSQFTLIRERENDEREKLQPILLATGEYNPFLVSSGESAVDRLVREEILSFRMGK